MASYAQPAPPPETAQKAREGPAAWEAEFVASDVFRSGSYIQPLWRGLSFEGHYFGGKLTDVGSLGATWTFRVGAIRLAPGMSIMFGTNETTTTPAITFRWDYERSWFVTQGLIAHGFRESPVFAESEGENDEPGQQEIRGYVRPVLSDGNHVSVRWKRLMAGASWEHIQFREGNEWKGGARVSYRIFPRISGVLYVLAPSGVEWRGGILVHPKNID